MRRIACIVAGLSLLMFAQASCAEDSAPAPAPSSEQIAPTKLVARLNSDDFDERSAAMEQLAKLGESAREALETALAGNDPDIRIAAAELLAKLRLATVVVQASDRSGKLLPAVKADCSIGDQFGMGAEPKQLTTGSDGTAVAGKTEPGIYNQNFDVKKFSFIGGVTNNFYRVRLAPGLNPCPIVLTAGGDCQGLVTNEQGKPLQDARLLLSQGISPDFDIDDPNMLNRFSNGRELSGNSEASGKAKIENVPDGVYRVVWSQENCESAMGPLVRIREGQTTEIPSTKLKPKSRGTLRLTLQAANGNHLDKASYFYSLLPMLGDPAAEAKALKAAVQARMFNNEAPVQTTDEKGQSTLENLKPGKFHLKVLTVDPNNQQRFVVVGQEVNEINNHEFAGEVEIKAGETCELAIKPRSGGIVKGRVVTDGGEPIRDAFVMVISEKSLIAAGVQFLTQNYADESIADIKYKQTSQDGVFEVKHVSPGRSVIYIRTSTGQTALVYGVNAVEGETVEAPEVKLNNPKKAITQVKGHILLSNGAPAIGATVYLETITANGRSSSGGGINDKGEFDFNSNWFNRGTQPNRVRVILAGFHSASIDLTDPGVNPAQLEIRLVKRDYGKLLVKTVDDSGKPLPGVRVFPTANPNAVYNQNGTPRPIQRSDERGEVRFSGVAEGPRKIRVEALGYFSDKELNVNVKKDDETAFTAVLHKGLTLAGLVELPPGVPAALATVSIRDNTGASMWQALKPDASFSVAGFSPGEYHVDAAAPGCGSLATLVSDRKKALNFVVKMVRNGAAALSLGAENAGKIVQIIRADSLERLNPRDFWQHYQNHTQDTIDGEGRVEFWNAEGDYLVLTSSENSESSERLSAFYCAGRITLKPIATAAELRGLPAPLARPAPGGGKVEFTLVPEFPQGTPDSLRSQYLTLFITGKDAMAWGYFQPQTETAAGKPIIIGAPPPELQSQSTDHYALERLPPGEYAMYALNQRSDARAEIIGDKPLAQFTVKDGQPLNIGDVKLPFPKFTPEEIETAQKQEMMNYENTDEDKGEVFKP